MHPDSAFHHPDPIVTPTGERIFMACAITIVLVGLPAALAAVFCFVVPLLGSAWVH